MLSIDDLGRWYLTNYTNQLLAIGGKRIQNGDGPEHYELPNHGMVSLVFAERIEVHLYLALGKTNLCQDLPGAGVVHVDTSVREATTELLTPPAEEASQECVDDCQTQELTIRDPELEPEVEYSKEVSYSFPASGTNHNLLYKSKDTVVNWYQSHTGRIKVVVKTVLNPRVDDWVKETQMKILKHVSASLLLFVFVR